MINSSNQRLKCRENWLSQLSDVINNPYELLKILELENNKKLLIDLKDKKIFPMKVPRSFVKKMEKGNPNDPLLKQVFITCNEFIKTPGFIVDPLREHNNTVPCLLHKYFNRVLLIIKNSCAVNCRYCFRKHFPYLKNKGNKHNWNIAFNYINNHLELDEIIFSGGDPLMAKDNEIEWLINQLEKITHIKRLRIHSRMPIMIASRITDKLISMFAKSRLKIILVNHINHANEIDDLFRISMLRLRNAGVILLNQSVLLKGVNDNAKVLAKLSNEIFDIGIIPYYLHLLDKVQGSFHFMVNEKKARLIIQELTEIVSGYMVPVLVKDVIGKKSKTHINIET